MATENFRVDLDADLAKRANSLFDKRGISRKLAVTRLLQWFLDQTPSVQAAILQQLPEDVEDEIATMVMQRIKAKRAKPVHGKAAPKVKGSRPRGIKS